MAIPESALATLAYDDLLDMKHIQGSDSWELFASIVQENPYANAVHRRFLRCASSWAFASKHMPSRAL